MRLSPFARRLAAGFLPLFAAPAAAQSPPPEASLPPLLVTGDRLGGRDQIGPLEGYRALTAASGTRTPTPIREIPQSITVLPGRLLRDQGAVTLEDALRNAPGVVPESPLFFNQNLNTLIRGFPAEIFRDGLQSYFDTGFGQSLLGTERIEVLRGPTSTLFGGGVGGGLGGAVNIVTQKPLRENAYEVGGRIGAYGFRGAFLDVNQTTGRRTDGGVEAMVRLQAEHQRGRSYIENVLIEGWQVLPAVTLRNERTSVTLQGFFSERRANDYPGLPPETLSGAAGFPFDRFRNANSGTTPRTVTQRNGLRLLAEHRIDEVFSLGLAGQYLVSNLEQPAQFQFGPALFDTTYARFNGYLQQDLEQGSVLPTATARFTTGPVRHTVLAGLEFDRTRDAGGIAFAFSDLYDFAAPVDAPFQRPPRAPVTRNRYTTVAGFLQEQATLWDRVHLLGAIRVTDLEIRSEPPGGPRSTAATTRWTPRLGIAVDVLPGLTPFFGWGTGIRSPSGYAFLVEAPRPEESEQWEVGLRVAPGFGLTGSVAYFDLERRNAVTPDPSLFGAGRQVGRARSRGVEVEAIWQPEPRLALIGSYAHVKAEIEEDLVLAPGTPLRLVPQNAGRLWAHWRFLDTGPAWLSGLSLGAGVTAVAGAPANDSASVRTKGYAIFDAQIAYEAGPARVALVARNIGDRRYTIPFSYFNNSVAPGAPAEVFLTASLRF